MDEVHKAMFILLIILLIILAGVILIAFVSIRNEIRDERNEKRNYKRNIEAAQKKRIEEETSLLRKLIPRAEDKSQSMSFRKLTIEEILSLFWSVYEFTGEFDETDLNRIETVIKDEAFLPRGERSLMWIEGRQDSIDKLRLSLVKKQTS